MQKPEVEKKFQTAHLGNGAQLFDRTTVSQCRTAVSNNSDSLNQIDITENLLNICTVSRLGHYVSETI